MARKDEQLQLKSIAASGFLPFDLADLQDVWTNLYDGNYFSAFKKAVAILDSVLNPPVTLAVGKGLIPVDKARVAQSFDKIKEWCDNNEGIEHGPHAAAIGEPGVTAVPIADIISLLRTLMQFYKMWKGDNTPTFPDGLTTMSNKNPKAVAQKNTPQVPPEAVKPPEAMKPPTVANTQVPPVNPAPTVEAARETSAAQELAKDIEEATGNESLPEVDDNEDTVPSVENTSEKESDAMRKFKDNEVKKNASKKGHK